MKNKSFAMIKLCLGLTLFILLTDPASAAKHELNLFLWTDYIDPNIVRDFSDKFDCRVILTSYEDAESMLNVISAEGAPAFDIVLPPDYMVPGMVKSNLLAPLRQENIPHLKNLDAKFLSPPFDPGNRYTAAYSWGTVGIYMRRVPGKPSAESWGLIFDPMKQPGSFCLIDSQRDMLSAALRYRGHPSNSTNPQHLKQARNLLRKAKKRSLGFADGAVAKGRVLSKRATAAIVYSSDGLRGMKEDAETYYFIPQEGGRIWVDNLAVLAQAPNREMAEKFINHILDPQIAARLATFLQSATPNAAAKEFLKPSDLKNAALYPPPGLMSKLDFWEDLGEHSELYNETWKKVMAK
jgi:spermidine/putrescine transport system substrate-binding protein